MPRKLICSLLITLVLSIPVSLEVYKIYNSYKGYKPVLSDEIKNPKSKETKVVARVGGYVLNQLTGWTSPFAEVTLTSQGLARKTTADGEGFFAFYYIPVPENLGELCLIAQDVNQLPSFPLCLAPPPKNQNLQIKDVLLSPTISLEGAQIPTGKTAKASGMTFPNSEVEVYFFTDSEWSIWSTITKIFPKITLPKFLLVQSAKCKVQNCNSKFKTFGSSVLKLLTSNYNFKLLTSNFKLVRSAYAFSLPSYKIRSNQNGYFEFSLPASSPSNNRIFSISYLSNLGDLSNLRSPKSNTLAFESVGFFGILLAFLKELFRQAGIFFSSFGQNPFGIILIELGILLGLIGVILVKRRKNGL